MTLPANVRVNAQLPFPALVQGSGPVTIGKTNGIWTVGFSMAGLGAQNPPLANYATDYLLGYDSVAKTLFTMSLASLMLPAAKFSTAALAAGTLAAGAVTGANFTVLQNTGATPGNQTVRTAAQMLADIPGAKSGQAFAFRIVNTGAGTLTLVADAGPTVTLTGTMTVAQNVFRDFVLTFTSGTTATIQSVGAGTSP